MLTLLRNPVFIGMLIPITAIIVGGSIAVIRLLIRHHERMAMIEKGIHPDHPPEEEDGADPSGSERSP